MRKWEKMLLVFLMAIILIVFLWSIMMIEKLDSPTLLELREKRATESMSIGRVSKED